MTVLLDRLRPHPHRGDVIAAGAVPLALAALLIELRMRQWSLGPRFVVVALLSGLILTMGWLAPLEDPSPRPYHTVLLIAGLLPLAVALVLLAEVLGARRPPGVGGLAWTFAFESALAAAAARRTRSAACTLVAAIAGLVAVEAAVGWVFRPQGLGTFRAVLLVLTACFGVGAVRLRDRERRHAVQLVNAAGVTALVLAATYVYAVAVVSLLRDSGAFLTAFGAVHPSAPFGWKLYLVAIGFGLTAYGAVDREPGPAYLGVLVLATFLVLAGLPLGERGSLVGWPLFLLAIGAAGLAVGLRPRRPLPPEPGPRAAGPAVPIDPDHRDPTST
jgi:hypothetical protein